MSKYFDKLVEINESLTKELKGKGLMKEGDDDEEMVPVPSDSLTDDQKKGILDDSIKKAGLKVDPKVLDDISKNPEQLAGVQKVLGAEDEQKNESVDDDDEGSGELVYVRMDDDDLEMHGYIGHGDKDFNLVDDEKDAIEFTQQEAVEEIARICEKYHYDYNTFNLQDVESQVADNGENWVSIDSSNPSATVVP